MSCSKGVDKYDVKYLILIFIIIFIIIHSYPDTIPNRVVDPAGRPGDIITSLDTNVEVKGHHLNTGHTGIYISERYILHTPGKLTVGKDSQYPIIISETEWYKLYPSSTRIRPKSRSLGLKAASNAIKYFKDKEIQYRITPNPYNIHYTYCSEIVWYSYYKSGKIYSNGDGAAIIIPRIFIDEFLVSYNDFYFVLQE